MGVVGAGQIDALGHMNFLEYQRLADEQMTWWWDSINTESLTHAVNAAGRPAYVTLESHVRYIRELRSGDAYSVTLGLVAFDSKKLIALQTILNEDRPACVVESLQLNFDLPTRRAVNFSPRVLTLLNDCKTSGGGLTAISRRLTLEPPPALVVQVRANGPSGTKS
jgi:acyl-CoA thioester hydrolase